jgi:hypothetical protein
MNLKDLIPEDKIRLLFDKWVIIQNIRDSEVSRRRRIIQDEEISLAYEVKNFELMNKFADLSQTRTSGPFYEGVIHFCNEESSAR